MRTTTTKRKRVVIAMSGGVDSSVASALLKEQGYDVIGISMQIWDHSQDSSDKFGSCCSPDDFYDARRIADKLKIPFYLLNFEKYFDEIVIDYFLNEYIRGRTPNPCIVCNKEIKFKYLLRKALELEADYIATGHYAKVVFDSYKNQYFLKKGLDSTKDQSYFLFNLDQEQLSKTLFPLGDTTKNKTRDIARRLQLSVSEKKESQEICFITDNDYTGFIRNRVGDSESGEIVDTNGKILGIHNGIFNYTIGQRRGLGVSSSRPLYVIKIDPDKNRIIIGTRDKLLMSSLIAKDVTWINPLEQDKVFLSSAKIRYNHKEARCKITHIEDHMVRVDFLEPQRAITPGQAIVFYDGDIVLGGGWIDNVL